MFLCKKLTIIELSALLLRLGCVLGSELAFDVNQLVASQQSVNVDALGDADVEGREAEAE